MTMYGLKCLAAPEDVGGEAGEGHHEGDPDAVGARQDGQVDAGIDEAEAGIQQIDEEPPPLDQQEPHADEDVQGGRLGLGEDPPDAGQGRAEDFQPVVRPRLDDVQVGQGGEQEEKADGLQVQAAARRQGEDREERAGAGGRVGVLELSRPADCPDDRDEDIQEKRGEGAFEGVPEVPRGPYHDPQRQHFGRFDRVAL